MPSGKTHFRVFQRASLLALPAIIATGPVLHWPVAIVAALAVGWIVGGVITPDLDYDGLDYFERRLLYSRRLFGIAWVVLWFPLAKLQTHRGVSHWPILGVLTRMVWLLILAQALILPLTPNHRLVLVDAIRHHLHVIVAFLVGQELAVEVSHIAVDRLATWYKYRHWQ